MTLPLRALACASLLVTAANAHAALTPVFADCDPHVPVWNGAGVSCSAIAAQTDATHVNPGAPDGSAYSLGLQTTGITGVAVFRASTAFTGTFSIFDLDDGPAGEAADVFVALADAMGQLDVATLMYAGTVTNGGGNPAAALTDLTVAGSWDFLYLQDASSVEFPMTNSTDGFDVDAIAFGNTVPEPGSLVLALLGLGGLGLTGRRGSCAPAGRRGPARPSDPCIADMTPGLRRSAALDTGPCRASSSTPRAPAGPARRRSHSGDRPCTAVAALLDRTAPSRWCGRRLAGVAALFAAGFLGLAPPHAVAIDLDGAQLLRYQDFLTRRFSGRSQGFAFTLVKGQTTLTEGAAGWAQAQGDGNVRMAVSTPSNIGSVSKLITGVALMHLLRAHPVAPGTVNRQLDQPLVRFLPRDWQEAYGARLSSLTLKHLLQHKSGLPMEGDEKQGFAALHWALRSGTRSPGREREYNNNNLSVMRFVIPRIAYPNETAFIDDMHAGKPEKAYWDAVLPLYNALFKKYVQTLYFPEIFNGTGPVCNPYDELGPRSFAKSYDSIGDRAGSFPRPDFCAPQGGFYFSVRQFARFAKVFGDTDKLVGNGIRERMMAPTRLDDRLVFNHVVTADDFVAETGRRHWVYHGGTFQGYRAAFVALPDGHYAAAVANTGTLSSTDLASALYYAFVYALKGLPAKHLSANDNHHFAYRDGVYVTSGDSADHDAERDLYRSTVGAGYTWDQIFEISANDAMHFTWIKDGHRLRVMAGSSDDLDRYRAPVVSRIDPNFYLSQLEHVSSNDEMHFAWYRSGRNLYVSAGPSHDLAGRRRAQSVTLPAGKDARNVRAIVSNDRMHFAYYDDCTYSAGQSRNLGSRFSGRSYDCGDLDR
jgi:hypothetical protein